MDNKVPPFSSTGFSFFVLSLWGICLRGTDSNPLTFSITKYVGFNCLISSKYLKNTTPLFSLTDNLLPAVLKA